MPDGWGNLGARPNPPNLPSKERSRLARASPRGDSSNTASAAPRGGKSAEGQLQLLVLRGDLGGVIAIIFRDAAQEIVEGGHAVARRLRKVGSAEEWLLLAGRQEHGQRPAAGALSDELLCGLIDLVQIGTFFAIHLDVDEQLVHQCGGGGILEGFVRHDMAPVTGRITDRQQNGLVLPFCGEQRLSSQGCQSTGLSACCSKYGLVCPARRLRCIFEVRVG